MLKELGQSYTYREYRDDPLSEAEIRDVLGRLGKSAGEMLRPKEGAAAGLTPSDSEGALVSAMAKEPTLLQRPIALMGDKALLARPADLLGDWLRM